MAGNPAWKKGAPSPNPAGRPVGQVRNVICKAWAERFGIQFVCDLAEGKYTEKLRIGKGFIEVPATLELRKSAATYIIDQGIGRAPQHVSLDGDGVVKDIATAMSEALKEARQASIIPVVPPEGQQPSLPS